MQAPRRADTLPADTGEPPPAASKKALHPRHDGPCVRFAGAPDMATKKPAPPAATVDALAAAVDPYPFDCFEQLARANTAFYAARARERFPREPCHPNSSVPRTEIVSVFHTTAPVAAPAHRLLCRVAHRAHADALCVVFALLVAVRFLELTGVHVTEATSARLLIGALRVAAKLTEDTVPTGAGFAAAAGIDPKELMRLETTLLRGLDWRVHAAFGQPGHRADGAGFAAAAGIDPKELMRLETTLLRGLDWRVHAAFGQPGGEMATASCAMLEDEAAERIRALPSADPNGHPLQHHDRLGDSASPTCRIPSDDPLASRDAHLSPPPGSCDADWPRYAVFAPSLPVSEGL
eukprot:CAMPEP_0174883048 /NCGR_PEP_ID=MMETSP1114-20130205/85071_1 /TAXON_ID=312471 /ORGANISM="Neobodo designis, Strain CCAP 1951/1" /LENGTH=349 /DNA_ID=CAMNT_0016118449 /DNA_START=418 /DNA_END=1468 /DNA_ORIENTATION=-